MACIPSWFSHSVRDRRSASGRAHRRQVGSGGRGGEEEDPSDTSIHSFIHLLEGPTNQPTNQQIPHGWVMASSSTLNESESNELDQISYQKIVHKQSIKNNQTPRTFRKQSLTCRNSLEHECFSIECPDLSASRTHEAYRDIDWGQTCFIS